MERPKQKDVDINLKIIKNLCEEYLDIHDRNDFDEDIEHYIFEEIMTALYGDEIWEYINQK